MAKPDLNRIRIVLIEKKMSVKELTEGLGKKYATVSRWCRNDTQPSLEQINEIADFLKVDIYSLIVPNKYPDK